MKRELNMKITMKVYFVQKRKTSFHSYNYKSNKFAYIKISRDAKFADNYNVIENVIKT